MRRASLSFSRYRFFERRLGRLFPYFLFLFKFLLSLLNHTFSSRYFFHVGYFLSLSLSHLTRYPVYRSSIRDVNLSLLFIKSMIHNRCARFIFCCWRGAFDTSWAVPINFTNSHKLVPFPRRFIYWLLGWCLVGFWRTASRRNKILNPAIN